MVGMAFSGLSSCRVGLFAEGFFDCGEHLWIRCAGGQAGTDLFLDEGTFSHDTLKTVQFLFLTENDVGLQERHPFDFIGGIKTLGERIFTDICHVFPVAKLAGETGRLVIAENYAG